MLAAAVLGSVGMIWAGVGWGLVLRRLGSPIGSGRAVALYFRGEAAKYVPGGVWAVVGRGELARREGVPAPVAYSSVLLSLGALYLACAGVAAVLLPAGLQSLAPVAVVGVVIFGFLGLHPRVLAMARRLVERMTRRDVRVDIPAWRTSVRLVLAYVPVWLAIGTATWSILEALGAQTSWPEAVLATCTSWLIGFLAVPVPGGVGVREAVFIAALPGASDGTAAAAAVLARILFMLVDGSGAALSYTRSARRT